MNNFIVLVNTCYVMNMLYRNKIFIMMYFIASRLAEAKLNKLVIEVDTMLYSMHDIIRHYLHVTFH